VIATPINGGMNRQNLWLYVALLVLAGLANLYLASSWLGSRAVAGMDRSLKAGAALLEARARTAPVDAQAASAVRADAGVDVTLLAGKGQVASSTLPNETAKALAAAAETPRRSVDVGSLGVFSGGLFNDAPEHRAMLVPLDGVAGAAPGTAVVISAAAAQHLAGLAGYQGSVLLVVLLLAAVGVALGLAVADGAGALPRELLQAAGRISTGDFTARAPRLAGSAGVVSDALNRAAESAAARREAAFSGRGDGRLGAEGDLGRPGGAAPAEAPAPAALSGAQVEGVPARPAPLAGARAPLPEADEAHWRGVFDDFVRVRGQTGEPANTVSYERFRTKLARNREQLVQRYNCKTVRFQVYVKQGKAAVRATPVR
jgi:hypothetical protein